MLKLVIFILVMIFSFILIGLIVNKNREEKLNREEKKERCVILKKSSRPYSNIKWSSREKRILVKAILNNKKIKQVLEIKGLKRHSRKGILDKYYRVKNNIWEG